MLVGALVAAVLSLTAAVSTYGLARHYMLQQRTEAAVAQVAAASRLVSASLTAGNDTLGSLLAGSQLLVGARAVLFRNGEWFVSGVGLSQDDLPADLVSRLEAGVPSRQRALLRAEPVSVVGYPIVQEPATWFVGVLSMRELARTLAIVQGALGVGVGLSVAGGAVVGWRLSRRVMEPLHSIGSTAQAVARGELDKRVEEPSEPDLRRIAHAFNDMTRSLSERIEREARFGAMVSHELKSPLMVIKGAAELVASRREDLPQRAQLGSDLLTSQIEEFEKILGDLIEISRYQSGTVTPQIEVLSSRNLVETLAARHRIDQRRLEIHDADIVVDARRLGQVFVNLKRNADLYAGGIEAIRSSRRGDRYLLHVDDAGVGVATSERERIFDPFVRGNHHTAVPGSGLGLAITREHARAMGADIMVESSPEGGARFTISFQVGDETQVSP